MRKLWLPSWLKNGMTNNVITPTKPDRCRKNHRIFYFLLLSLLVVFAGCSTTPKEKRLEKDGLTLMYHPKFSIGSESDHLKLQHPVNISEDMVRIHLRSLYYEEMTLMGKEKSVFTAEDIDKITPWVSKALNRVNPNNVIYFEVQTPKGNTVVEVFGDGKKLHWRFSAIRGVDFSKNQLIGWGNTWRLVPKEGQNFYQISQFLGKKTLENWIVADLDLPDSGGKLPGRQSASQKPKKQSQATVENADTPQKSDGKKASGKLPAGKNQELEEKLRFLKQLQDKGLIDEDEYKRKRKALMDEYL